MSLYFTQIYQVTTKHYSELFAHFYAIVISLAMLLINIIKREFLYGLVTISGLIGVVNFFTHMNAEHRNEKNVKAETEEEDNTMKEEEIGQKHVNKSSETEIVVDGNNSNTMLEILTIVNKIHNRLDSMESLLRNRTHSH